MKEIRQCPSCGGICRKSGCERANLDAEWDIRGTLASALKCWHRLTGEEAAELVAFVAALQSAQPKQEPLTDEAIYSIVLSEFKCVPLPYDIRLTRAIEAAHGINGMVEAATRPAIDVASKQGGQHE